MLEATLSATVADDTAGVELALTVTNDGDAAESLSFRTGQRAEFTARAADGDEEEPVWRHGDGRMFTQALGSETLEAGESATFRARWDAPPAGTYEVTGETVATDADASATTTVVVGDGEGD